MKSCCYEYPHFTDEETGLLRCCDLSVCKAPSTVPASSVPPGAVGADGPGKSPSQCWELRRNTRAEGGGGTLAIEELWVQAVPRRTQGIARGTYHHIIAENTNSLTMLRPNHAQSLASANLRAKHDSHLQLVKYLLQL